MNLYGKTGGGRISDTVKFKTRASSAVSGRATVDLKEPIYPEWLTGTIARPMIDSSGSYTD